MCESIKLILNYIFVLVTIVFKCILKCSIYNLFSIKKHLGIDEKKPNSLASFWIYRPPATTVVSVIQLNPLNNPMMWVVSPFYRRK